MIEIIVAIIGAVATIAAVIITGRANHRYQAGGADARGASAQQLCPACAGAGGTDQGGQPQNCGFGGEAVIAFISLCQSPRYRVEGRNDNQ